MSRSFKDYLAQTTRLKGHISRPHGQTRRTMSFWARDLERPLESPIAHIQFVSVLVTVRTCAKVVKGKDRPVSELCPFYSL